MQTRERTELEAEPRTARRVKRSRRAARRRPPSQGELFARTWGGARTGAGRKQRGPRALVSHRARHSFRPGCPLHVTLRLVDGLPNLRHRATYRALTAAMGGHAERSGMQVVHWSALGNHLHFLVEAADQRALSRGMQGLAVRMARALNRSWKRAGRVFADRFHARVLPSPREVRSALAYVLHNARHHGIEVRGADPYSSGPWFDGWLDGERAHPAAVERPHWLRAARTWLLARGWQRLGLIDVHANPSGP